MLFKSPGTAIDLNASRAYTKPLPVKAPKYDLIKPAKKYVPPIYINFYENLVRGSEIAKKKNNDSVPFFFLLEYYILYNIN